METWQALMVGAGTVISLIPLMRSRWQVPRPQVVRMTSRELDDVALYAYHSNNCTGTRDFVDVGELAHGVGSVGSILIVARTSGSASPWYIIRYSDSTRCWRTPTAIATSVYLNHRGAGGW